MKPAAKPTPRVVALHAYQATKAGQLSFAQDDVMTVLDKTHNWWYCEHQGKHGLVPSNYVTLLPTTNALPPLPPPSARLDGAPKAEVNTRAKTGKGKDKAPVARGRGDVLTTLRTTVLADINRRLGGYYTALHGAPLGDDTSRLDLADVLEQEFLNPAQSEQTQPQPKPRVCVLLGNSGSGKTWFGLNLVKHLWQAHRKAYNPKVPIPLWVPLKGMKGDEKRVLQTYLKALGLKKRTVKALQETGYPLFIVLDGYDELATDKNLYLANGWATWKNPVQVLITCRHEVLIGGFQANQERFQASLTHKDNPRVFVTKPFDKDQIDTVVKRYVACRDVTRPGATVSDVKGKEKTTTATITLATSTATSTAPTAWNAERYLTEMAKLPELQALIDKPFVLWIVLESLPDVVAAIEAQAASQHTQTQQPPTEVPQTKQTPAREQRQRQQLTRYRLYQQFLQGRIAREVTRLSGMKDGKIASQLLKACRAGGALDHFSGNSLGEIFANYSRQLALAMHQRRRYVVHWQDTLADETSPVIPEGIDVSQPVKGKEKAQRTHASSQHDRWAAPFLNTKRQPLLKYLLDASPLYRDSAHSWAFLHASLIEHAVSEDLFNGAAIEAWMMTGQNLNASNLQQTPDILHFLVDQVHSLPDFKAILFEVIQASRHEPRYWKAAANAATILNWAGISFTHQDWQRVRLGGKEHDTDETGWGADLSQAILGSTNLSEADLRYVNLSQAWCRHANLRGACLDGITLGEWASLKGNICTYSPDGKYLAVAGEDKNERWFIHVYDATTHERFKQLRVPKAHDVTCLAFHPQGAQLASGSDDNTVRLWVVATGRCERVLEGHTGYVTCLAYHPQGTQLASGSPDKTIRLWAAATGRCERVLTGHTGIVTCLAYRPHGAQLASGSLDNTVRLWAVASGRCERVLKGHTNDVNCLAYHPQGAQLASGSDDNTVRLWAVASGRPERVLKGDTDWVTCLAYHPQGTQLASGSIDKTVRLWAVATGRCERVLTGHTDGVDCLAYHPQGAQLASGSGDNTVRLWSVASGQTLAVLDGFLGRVSSLAWSPDGQYLATGSADNAVRLWAIHCKPRNVNYQFLWQRGGAVTLNTQRLNLAQTTGLKDQPQILRLLKQRSETTVFGKKGKEQRQSTLQGEPSQTLTSEKVLKARAAQVHVTKGHIEFSTPSGDFIITPESWFLAMVKKKKASPHVWLLLYGLTPEHYTRIQALHFYQDTNKPTRLGGTVGKGLIQIRDISPFDLKGDTADWLMRPWSISQQEAQTLLANVRQDQQADLGYLLSGRDVRLFSRAPQDTTTNAYNCLSWCEKQLKQIGKQPLTQKKWIDFIVAVPGHYLPAEEADTTRRARRGLTSRLNPSRLAPRRLNPRRWLSRGGEG